MPAGTGTRRPPERRAAWLLEIESRQALGVSASMVLMTAATCTWWGAVARRHRDSSEIRGRDRPRASCLMLLASALAFGGALRACRQLRGGLDLSAGADTTRRRLSRSFWPLRSGVLERPHDWVHGGPGRPQGRC